MQQRPLLILVPLVMATACGGADPVGDPDSGGTADASLPDARPAFDADDGEIPRVEPASCRFHVPDSLGLFEGADYECGDLVVHENRGAPSATLKVHYVRIFSSAASPNATIYLDGGPGGNGDTILGWAGYLGATFLDSLLVDGDFLVIAQRGTSLSEPSLMCEYECDLEDIAHLPSYNTAYNADDVDDLRAALGYEKLNLYGISYGSRLGLEVMRRHGENLRSAVIGGLVPAQVVWPAEIPASFYSALTALDASCADHGSCATAFGDLVAKFMIGVDALDAAPISFYYQEDLIELDGVTYAYLLFQLMYAKRTFPWLPFMISDLAERRTDRVGDFIGEMLDQFGGQSDLSVGLYYAIVCGELFNPPDESAFETATADIPVAIRQTFANSWYGLLDYCATWPVGAPLTGLNEPVTSGVRTFLASGTVDPITPPSFGELAASTLTNRVVVVYENSGHGATLQTSCGQETLRAFLTDPSQTPDTSCAAAITTDYVLPGSVAAPSLPLPQIAFELGQAQIPPHMRRRLEAARRPLR